MSDAPTDIDDTESTDADTETDADAEIDVQPEAESDPEPDADADAEPQDATAAVDEADEPAPQSDAGSTDEAQSDIESAVEDQLSSSSDSSDVSLEDFSETPDNEIDYSEYEDQEWTLGQTRQAELQIDGMKFLLSEPEDDEQIMQLLEQTGDYQGSLRSIVDMLVVAPKITDEKWEDKMTPRQRMLLAGRAVDWFGIDDFIDEDSIDETDLRNRDGDLSDALS